VEAAAAAKADLVFVCLGAPKQRSCSAIRNRWRSRPAVLVGLVLPSTLLPVRFHERRLGVGEWARMGVSFGTGAAQARGALPAARHPEFLKIVAMQAFSRSA